MAVVSAAALRRLNEELGFTTPLEKVFDFTYKAPFDNGLTEHEFDHVYYGTTDMQPTPEPTEVKDWRYISLQDLAMDVESTSNLLPLLIASAALSATFYFLPSSSYAVAGLNLSS